MKLATSLIIFIAVYLVVYGPIFNKQNAKGVTGNTELDDNLIDYYNSINGPGKQYIIQHAKEAIRLSKASDLSASIILGTAMHESDMGRSLVSVTTNNHFGITDPKGNYRKYSSINSSYKHFIELMDAPRYQYVRMYNGAWDFQALEIQKSGYASDTLWAKKVSYLIEQYSLWKIDQIIKAQQAI